MLGIKSTPIASPVVSTQDLLTTELDEEDDCTSDYFSRAHSRQSSSVCCLDELLGELEERRDSSILFVEEEVNEIGDDDGGMSVKPAKKFQLRWRLKPKALFRNGRRVVSSVSSRWQR